eukprot:CAMPEP_0194047854 /NCGR_PEP_ID=MMETSP0009_2-20130614/25849_1 /TAXON_ID=210454 /ORGANISM="Grammatophora oceanica, Strain CCMP 410" /LENGTH=128 /DNA_ID=CAMNT_0038693581 /DNA_START=44 /DNA_END=430 /DNA_ORIENTATION=+
MTHRFNSPRHLRKVEPVDITNKLPRGYENRSQRSESLPILNRCEGLSSSAADAKANYDYATWAMYHRIVSARRQRSQQASPATTTEDKTSNQVAHKREANLRSASQHCQQLLEKAERIYDGEVFALDL